MKDKKKHLFRFAYGAVRAILLVSIFAYLGKQIIDGRAALDHLTWGGRPAIILALAFLFAVIAYQLLFIAWLIMLKRSGLYRPGQLPVYARIWWVSYMFRYVPGKILLVVERARLGARAGIPHSAGAAMPVLETVLAVFAGSLVSLLAIAYYSDSSGKFILGLLVAVGSGIFLIPAGLHWLVSLPPMQRRYPDLQALTFSRNDILTLIVPYLLHYILLGIAVFLLARCFTQLSWMDLPGVLGIYALAHVVGLLVVFSPAGLGIREGSFAIQLDKILPASVAGILAIAARILFTTAEILSFLAVVLTCPAPREIDNRVARTDSP